MGPNSEPKAHSSSFVKTSKFDVRWMLLLFSSSEKDEYGS